eukprot:2989091-Amphidinium_carterae.1
MLDGDDACEEEHVAPEPHVHGLEPHWEPLPQFARKALAKYLAENIHSHCHIPASLGTGHTDLTHKASSLAHQIAVECETEQDLLRWMGGIRSWTSDFGVEAGLTEFRLSADKLLPDWWSWGIQHDGAADEDDEVALRMWMPSEVEPLMWVIKPR